MGGTPRALDVAYYFLGKGQEADTPISNKKLQKLVYYAQAWTFVFSKKPIFNDKIEAWVHGPAVRSLYGRFKEFGFNPIQVRLPEKRYQFEARQKILDDVWEIYGELDANYLEHLTHSEDPWKNARNGLETHRGSSNEIDLESMRVYYSKLLKSLQKEGA